MHNSKLSNIVDRSEGQVGVASDQVDKFLTEVVDLHYFDLPKFPDLVVDQVPEYAHMQVCFNKTLENTEICLSELSFLLI